MCGILKEILEEEPLWAKLFAAVQTEEDDARVADRLVPAIREENRRRGRTMLVMLENLGEILDQQIRRKNHVAALRQFFMGDNGCLLLATAPRHFDGITDVSQPFYDFFDTQILDYLSFGETVEVIRLNLEWEERTDILETLDEMRPRLQALYRMTGGNPRLTMMLYELIAHESVISVQDQFLQLLDRISPFYQGRLNDLPPGQRALLECLASMRDQEKTPAAIAARMRMSQQEDVVASQASHQCPLPARRPAPAGQAFAPLHDSRGFLRHLARDEPLPRRAQAHAVPARLLQPLLPEHRRPRGKAASSCARSFSKRAAMTRKGLSTI